MRHKLLLSLSAFLLLVGCDDEPIVAPPPVEPLSCQADIDVGETPLRRITRHQYNLSARAVLGVNTTISESFVADERVGAFYSNAIAPVTELGVEQYMEAAELLADEAILDLASLLTCDPAVGEAECVRQFANDLAARAFRRPITTEETDALFAVYETAREDGPFEEGVKWIIVAALSAPAFLYHVEEGVTSAEEGVANGVKALRQHELASRLSFFLWSAPPDEELRAAADAGELTSRDAVEAHVRRMLADDRARETIASFHHQWLVVEELPEMTRDEAQFPGWSAEIGEQMLHETEAFAHYVLTEGDGRLETMLTGRFTFVTQDLAAIYDLPAPSHGGFEGVFFDDASPRAGLLTQGAFLAAHSHDKFTSPTFRGKVIRENLLCNAPPPPPADVNDQLPDEGPDVLQDLLEKRLTEAPCNGCHVLMDKIGLGLEAFDSVGAHRTSVGDFPVDDAGEFVATDDIDGAFDGAIDMASRLSTSSQVRACVSNQWFRFSLGRTEDEGRDACSLATIGDRFAASDYDLRELIVGIALSDAMFYLRQPEGQP